VRDLSVELGWPKQSVGSVLTTIIIYEIGTDEPATPSVVIQVTGHAYRPSNYRHRTLYIHWTRMKLQSVIYWRGTSFYKAFFRTRLIKVTILYTYLHVILIAIMCNVQFYSNNMTRHQSYFRIEKLFLCLIVHLSRKAIGYIYNISLRPIEAREGAQIEFFILIL